VNVAGTFIEGLSRCQGDRLFTLDLHHDGPLEHVEKRVSIVSMNGVRSTSNPEIPSVI
jgi:hypothetical protein